MNIRYDDQAIEQPVEPTEPQNRPNLIEASNTGICSFCLRERLSSDLLPLGPEIDAHGQLHHESICERCDARILDLQREGKA